MGPKHGLFLAVILAASMSLSAAEFAFDATGVTATVTPSTTTYWMCACTGSLGGSLLLSNYVAIIPDDDGDGIVRWELGTEMKPWGIFSMIDQLSGEITSENPNGKAVAPSPFPGKAFLRDESGSYVRFAMNLTDVRELDGSYYFWIRPGVGIWKTMVWDNGSRDGSGWPDEVIIEPAIFSASNGTPPPTRFEQQDYLVLMGMHAEYWTGDNVGAHLRESWGPGVVEILFSGGDEGLGKARINLFRLEGTDGPASVHLETSDGTAIAGVDYQPVSKTVSFGSGQITSSVEVPITDNLIYENAPRYFHASLSNPEGAGLGPHSSAVVPIVDNESIPLVELGQSTATETDAPQEVPLRVRLSHTSSKRVTLDWRLFDRFQPATTITSGVLYFEVGEVEKAMPIIWPGDVLYTGTHSYTVRIANAVNAQPVNDGRLTILEDEPRPVLSIENAHVSEGEGEARVNLHLTAPMTWALNVPYVMEPNTATSPDDFTASSGTIAIPAGSTSATLRIPIQDDSLLEGLETFEVALLLDPEPRATVTILDDETPLVTIERRTIVEGDGGPRAVPMNVTLSRPALGPVKLNWKAYEGTPGVTLETGVVELAIGEREKSFEVHYVADDLYGGDRAIVLGLTSATNARESGVGKLTIEEDDPKPQMTIENVFVPEHVGEATLTVHLSAPLATVLHTQYNTENGTATAPADFARILGTFEFPSGCTTATIRVPIVDDDVPEPDEMFDVVIPWPIGEPSALRATVTIANDDTNRRRGARH